MSNTYDYITISVDILCFLDTLISLADEIQMMHPSNNGYEKVNKIIRSTNLCIRRIKHVVITGNHKIPKAFTTGAVR